MKKVFLTIAFLVFVFPVVIFAQWERVTPSGIFNHDIFFSMAIDGKNLIFSTANGYSYISTDNGVSWSNKIIIKNKYNQNVRFYDAILMNDTILAACSDVGMVVSHDFGITWDTISANNGFSYHQMNINESYSLSKDGDMILCGSPYVVFISGDNGVNWQVSGLNNDQPNEIAISNKRPFVLLQARGVFTSKDTGQTWEKINFHEHVGNIAYNGNSLFFSAIDSRILYISTDNGETCTEIKKYPNNTKYNNTTLTFCGNNIYIGNDSGVYVSTNSGDDWIQKNGGLEYLLSINKEIIALHFHKFVFNDDYIFAGTIDGIYRAKITNCMIDEPNSVSSEPVESPFGVVPNPADEYIEISVGSWHALTNTDIRIYNVFGETVSTSVCSADTSASGGQKIDVSGLPSGVYFIKVGGKVGKFVKI